MNSNFVLTDVPGRYLKLRGTLQRAELQAFTKLMKEMFQKGKEPLNFKEKRTYFYAKSGRQVDILQFADRTTNLGKQYSIRHRGMTSIRKNNLRSGLGGEYMCSEEGAGLLQEMGMLPIKEKQSAGCQWVIGDGIYLVVSDIKEITKGEKKVECKNKPYQWEMICFCNGMMEEEVSKIMQMSLDLLQPYLKVCEKPNRGC